MMVRLLEDISSLDDGHHDEEDLEGHDGEGFGAGGFNSGLPHNEPEAMAWFHIVFSLIYFLVGLAMLYKMYESRHVLEIRARSVYLILTLGVCLLIDFAMDIHVECVHLFQVPTNVFATHLVFFFTVFTIEACYISRVIRLGVSFSQKTKKAMPWIMSEKLLVTVSLCIGVLSTFIPGYYFIKTNGGDYLVDFVLVELEVVWKCQVGLVAVQLVLLPIVWMVDDIYRISWELGVIVLLGLVDVVIVRMSATNVLTVGVKQYISSSNIGLLWSSAVFGLSVIDPLRRMIFNPMARPLNAVNSKDGHEHKKHTTGDTQCRKLMAGHHHQHASFGLEMPDSSHNCSSHVSDDESDRFKTGPNSARSNTSSKWSYDKMAAIPTIAKAFRDFALRALCQESVMFLEEVTKYERGDYEIARPISSQFQAFELIAKKFVVDGSQDEINISSRDKKKILDVYRGGSSIFFSLQEEERRLIFRDAYVEIRSMLETNLVHRFLTTEGFRQMKELYQERDDQSRDASPHI